MEQFQVPQVININKIMKMPNFPYILSVTFITFSLTLVSLYTMISSYSDMCGSFVSVMKFDIGRNNMFILCNGILVVLVRSSSSSLSQEISSDDEIISKTVDNSQKMSSEPKGGLFVTTEENECVVHKDNDFNDEYENGRNDRVEDEDEDEGEDAEELNRRCEEFIRRMKQGILFESWQSYHGLLV
ncbi:hypothetical protein vseg_007599 [Gypsophila vaccaria]